MEYISLEIIIDVIQIILMLAIILLIKEFRNTWWKGHCAGAVLATQHEEKMLDQFGGIAERLDKQNIV